MSAGFYKFTCTVLIWIVLVAPPSTEAAVTCGTVASYLQPCVSYVVNNGPIGGCCAGVKGLYGAAKTPADRKTVCTCLKSIAGQYSGASLSRAAGLPAKCGVSIPYKISPSTDCSKVT